MSSAEQGERFPVTNHAGLADLRSYVAGEEWEGGAHPSVWTEVNSVLPCPLPLPAELARRARQPGLWAAPDEASARALQRTQLELSRRWGRSPELVVKAWACVTQHLSSGRQLERVLLATDRALYRCCFNYSDGELREVRRVPWDVYGTVNVGPFAYHADGLLPIADATLSASVDGLWGVRLFNRRPVVVPRRWGALLAGATFLQESIVDNGVCVTFSAIAPPLVQRAGSVAARCFSRDTAAEFALVCYGLMLHAAAQSPELLRATTASSQRQLPYSASASLLAALHLSLGFSRERHAAMMPQPHNRPEAGGQQPVHPWGTADAGGMPESGKLIVRRCM